MALKRQCMPCKAFTANCPLKECCWWMPVTHSIALTDRKLCIMFNVSAQHYLPFFGTPISRRHICLSLVVTDVIKGGYTPGRPTVDGILRIGHTLPIIQHLQQQHDNVRQICYADDLHTSIECCWRNASVLRLVEYYTGARAYVWVFHNPDKTLLRVKPDLEEEASQLFDGTGVRIVTGSVKYLGSYIGEPDAVF